MFVDRDPDRPVRHLEWRVRLLGAGAVLALVGMYYRARWIVWTAIVVLVVGFALRFAPPRRNGGGPPDGEPPESDGSGSS